MKLKKVIVSVLLCVTLTMFLSFCVACGGYVKINKMQLNAIYSNKTLELNIKSDKAVVSGLFTCVNFVLPENLDTLAENIEKSGKVTEIEKSSKNGGDLNISDSLFLKLDNGDGTKDYFSIILKNKNSDKECFYLFNALRGEIVYQSGGKNEILELLMPVMWCENEADYFNFDTEYKTTATQDDFYVFYKDSGWFDVENTASGVIINGFKAGVNANNDFENHLFDFKIKISINNNGEKNLVKYEIF